MSCVSWAYDSSLFPESKFALMEEEICVSLQLLLRTLLDFWK